MPIGMPGMTGLGRFGRHPWQAHEWRWRARNREVRLSRERGGGGSGVGHRGEPERQARAARLRPHARKSSATMAKCRILCNNLRFVSARAWRSRKRKRRGCRRSRERIAIVHDGRRSQGRLSASARQLSAQAARGFAVHEMPDMSSVCFDAHRSKDDDGEEAGTAHGRHPSVGRVVRLPGDTPEFTQAEPLRALCVPLRAARA